MTSDEDQIMRFERHPKGLDQRRLLEDWRRKWQSTPVFLPGESHEQRSLAGYSTWGRKDLDTT